MVMQPRTDFDLVVIGGGIVGLASAYQIAQRCPGVRLAVLEKEERLTSDELQEILPPIPRIAGQP